MLNRLSGVLLHKQTGIDAVHVPYKGGPQAVSALITGEAAYMVVNVEMVLPQVAGGKACATAIQRVIAGG